MDFEQQRNEERRLRDAMQQARALYDGAKDAFDRQTELFNDLGASHADGSLQHATRVYNETQKNYRGALMAFNRFVLDKQIPGGGGKPT